MLNLSDYILKIEEKHNRKGIGLRNFNLKNYSFIFLSYVVMLMVYLRFYTKLIIQSPASS